MVYRDLARDLDLGQATPKLLKAIENYDQALALGVDPVLSESSVFWNRAWAFTALREYSNAIRDLTSAIDLGETWLYDDRGFVYALQGLDEDASRDFDEVSKAGGSYAGARNLASRSLHNSADCFGISERFWSIVCPTLYEKARGFWNR